jgi:hypothetical protein
MKRSTLAPVRRANRPPATAILAAGGGALALGALAIGIYAIGRLVIGRLVIGRARFHRLEVDELTVGRLQILDGLRPDARDRS